jgi:hypothetical protein
MKFFASEKKNLSLAVLFGACLLFVAIEAIKWVLFIAALAASSSLIFTVSENITLLIAVTYEKSSSQQTHSS